MSGRSLISWIVGSRSLSALKSRSQALISARRAKMSMAVGDDDHRVETDAEQGNENGWPAMGQSLEEAWLSLSLSPTLFKSPPYRSLSSPS